MELDDIEDKELFFDYKRLCELEGIHMSEEELIHSFKECQFFEKHGIGRFKGLKQMHSRIEHFIKSLECSSNKK